MLKSKPILVAACLLQSTRPRQWVKNVLVCTVPLAAGVSLFSLNILLTVASFILVSGGLYTLNDILDKDSDMLHPEKSGRPVASGKISAKTGVLLAAVCIPAGLTTAAVVNASVFGLLLLYALLVAAYSIGLKQLPWLEVAIVSTGFVLRMAAGGLAISAPISKGFLAVSFFGSAVIVLAKRCSELVNTSLSGLHARASVGRYSLRSLSTGMYFGLFVATSLYILTGSLAYDDTPATALHILSAVPMALAGLTLIRQSFAGKAESLDRLLAFHRPLAALTALWVSLFVASAYVGVI